jgi:hypothetical protein
MKDRFYGDNRDLVKWGGIVHICHEKSIRTVLQVAYYRKDEWGETINFNGKSIALPGEVIKHFRDIQDITRLGRRAKLRILVFGIEFSKAKREAYCRRVLNRIKSVNHMNQRKMVFLDPDTGLAPEKCEAEHVTEGEVRQIWESLSRKDKDVLVFYQHNTHSNGWEESNRKKLSKWCRVGQKRVKMWSAKEIAGDVVLYFIER